MNEVLLRVMQTLISMFEIGAANQLLFFTTMNEEEVRGKEKIVLIINVVVTGILLSMNRNLLFFSNSMLILTILIGALCTVFVERKKKCLSILLVALYHLVLTLFDFIFAFISMIFLGNEFEQAVYWYANSYWKCLIYIASRILIFGCITFLKRRRINWTKLDGIEKVFIVVDIALFYLITLYHIKLETMASGIQYMEGGITSISLISIMVISFLVAVLSLKNLMVKKENELLLIRDKMIQQNYIELERAYEQSRHLMHDIKNHFLILKDLEKRQDFKGIQEYLEEIEKNYKEISIRSWTGNRILDLILGQKVEEAEQKGIEIQLDIIPVPEWDLEDSELCSLFGNLLDNAIEACEEIENDKKNIFIEIKKQGQLVFVKIKNTISNPPLMKNGRPISNKKDKKSHGYGVKNVDRIMNKYEGEIIYQIFDESFQVCMTFFVKKKIS